VFANLAYLWATYYLLLALNNGEMRMSYRSDRAAAIAKFERDWLAEKLQAYAGNVTLTAQAEVIDRVYMHRLMRRHGTDNIAAVAERRSRRLAAKRAAE
jgi:transcriptional regulator of acetoin/glycerol metabolism